MKSILRNLVFNLIAIVVISSLIKGLNYSGGYQTLIIASLLLTLMNLILKPIINLILTPISFLSFGLLSWLSNILILFLLTNFYSLIMITGFTFYGFSYHGFTIPSLTLNFLEALILISLLIALVNNFFTWLTHK